MIRLIEEIAATYIITLVITGSSLLLPFRAWFIQKTPWLQIDDKHPITCRLCTGFWVSLAICLLDLNFLHLASVYGISYFVATQER